MDRFRNFEPGNKSDIGLLIFEFMVCYKISLFKSSLFILVIQTMNQEKSFIEKENDMLYSTMSKSENQINLY